MPLPFSAIVQKIYKILLQKRFKIVNFMTRNSLKFCRKALNKKFGFLTISNNFE